MTIDEIAVPDTAACSAALEVATAYYSPALLNHSVRSYLWAAAYGTANKIEFDAELLYVAAILHDLGLVEEFDNPSLSFEVSGGHLAWVFGAAAGWPAERRVRASDVIIAHMADDVDVEADPEGHLLELSTALDISGRSPDAIPAELRAEVLEQYPRLGLAEEFVECFKGQAARKPESSAAAALRSGIAARIAVNPLDH